MKPFMAPVKMLAGSMFGATLVCQSANAQVNGSIKQPRAHTIYSVELEPHMAFGFERYSGYATGFGPGVRVSFPLSDEAFIPEINNSVGIGVGLDLLFHNNRTSIQVPVVMQWNFFFHKRFSAFFEPGLGFAYTFDDGRGRVFPNVAVGGRVHFSEKMAFTFRLGYPATSLGLSFLF